MDSPPYHYPYHHSHDPTIINVHSLLKPQPYQYPSFSNTQSSPFTSYTPFYQQPHNITTSHGLDAGISNSPSTFTSSLTPTSQLSSHITPSSIPYTNTHISPPHSYSNFIANNSSHYLPHHINIAIKELQRSQKACIQAISNLATDISALNQSFTPPNYTHRFPDQLYASHKPFTHQQPHTISISDPILENTVEFTDIVPLKLEANLPIQSNPNSVSEVVGEHVIAEDFNDVAPSKLKLDLPTTLSTETDARSREDVVAVKDQITRDVPPSISQPWCDSDNARSKGGFSFMNDSSAVEIGEEFNKFLDFQETLVTKQLNEEGTKILPILNPTITTTIVDENVLVDSKPDEKLKMQTTEKKVVHESLRIQSIVVVPRHSFPVEFTDTEPLKLEPDLTIHSDPVLPVIGEQHAAKDFNDEAPSNLVLDFTTTFPSPKTEDPLRADNVTVKDQGEDNHRLSPSIIPSPCNSDRVESSTSQSCISVPMSLAPVKHCLVTTIRPSPEKTVASTVVVAAPLQRHLFIFDFGGDERRVHSLAAIFGNGDCVFDPGGDKCIFCSPALISINNYGTQSPLQLPWDRGKLGVSKSPISVQSFECFLFTSIRSITPPVTIFDPGGDKFNPVEDSGGSHGGRRVAVNGLQ
ncbi:hypothetical protein QL285_070730 [Trifolium repens]|nr:hypothetical protein QL285_070730 [Trifolium repens]